MIRDPEMTEVVRREIGEALDELLALGEGLSSGTTSHDEFVRTAFRIFHNTKGALRLGGFPAPERVVHLVEDRLSDLREAGEAIAPDLVDLMEQALSICVEAVDSDGEHPELAAVLLLLEGVPTSPPVRKKDAPGRALKVGGGDELAEPALGAEREQSPEDSAPLADAPSEVAQVVSNGGSKGVIRIGSSRLDRLMELGSEYLAQHARTRRQARSLRNFSDDLTALMKKDPALRALGAYAAEFEVFVRAEERELRRATQLTADFDRAMREVRMQPLSVIVPRLRRIVSEVSRELGKKIRLNAEFGEVELDREVLDALSEPLMHLLRNAADHGIDNESERLAGGKAARGEITVSARVAGTNVEITVADDGRGVDLAKVRRRAVQLGLIADEEALADLSLLDFALFAPGFSTATQVTAVSGRGVGLDSVRSRVSELGGQVFCATNGQQSGMAFTLSVPASVVSLRGLSVTAGGATFVLPSAQVERTLRVRADELGSAEGTTIVRTPEGEPLRLRWLSLVMGRVRREDPPILQVVVVSEGTQFLGLVVDEVHGDTTFVIKRLPWNVRRAPGVIGATHQGDAALALVVDMTPLFRNQTAGHEHRVAEPPKRVQSRILVADDSLTSRTLERNILMGAGYMVKVVEDGAEALKELEKQDYDLLVSDVQMPNMDGLQLARCVRAHQRLSNLPIILVTSLDRPDDIAEGANAGADEYIVKGQFDQEALLLAVSRLL